MVQKLCNPKHTFSDYKLQLRLCSVLFTIQT